MHATRIFVLKMTCGLTILIAGIFVVVNIMRGTWLGVGLDLMIILAQAGGLYIATVGGREKVGGLMAMLCIVPFVLLIAPTGLPQAYIWTYPMPIVAFLLLGPRHGLFFSLPLNGLVAGCLLVFPLKIGGDVLAFSIIMGLAMVVAVGWVAESARSRLENMLRRDSLTDPLTGAWNRRRFLQAFDAECARSERSGQTMTVLLIDLDGFKSVNDQYGHPAGDRLLCAVVERLGLELRRAEMLARVGGDEFAVLATNTDAQRAEVMGERLRRAVAELRQDGNLGVTLSVGIADGARGERPDSVWKRADAALYQAKGLGGDMVVRWRSQAAPSAGGVMAQVGAGPQQEVPAACSLPEHSFSETS